MNVIRSHKYEVYTEEVNKVALCPNDDKTYTRGSDRYPSFGTLQDINKIFSS